MSERFTCRPVPDPVLVKLIELQQAFKQCDQYAENAGRDYRTWNIGRRQERDDRGGSDLRDFDPLIPSHVGCAFSVVPANLVLQALDDRIRGRARIRSFHGRQF